MYVILHVDILTEFGGSFQEMEDEEKFELFLRGDVI